MKLKLFLFLQIACFTIFIFLNYTYSFLTDKAKVLGMEISAAEIFPSPTTAPTPTGIPLTPTVTLMPTPTAPQNLCNSINVNILGNGAGSVNGVYIICVNWKVISQSSITQSETVVNSNVNTGNNTSDSNSETGDASSVVTVEIQGGVNNMSSSTPMLTTTP